MINQFHLVKRILLRQYLVVLRFINVLWRKNANLSYVLNVFSNQLIFYALLLLIL